MLFRSEQENHNRVAIARHMYKSALHIVRHKYAEWQPQVLTCSALEKLGIDEVWQTICDFRTQMTSSGRLQQVRQLQEIAWLKKQTEAEALRLLFSRDDFDRYYHLTQQAVKNNRLSPRAGLQRISEYLQNHYFA